MPGRTDTWEKLAITFLFLFTFMTGVSISSAYICFFLGIVFLFILLMTKRKALFRSPLDEPFLLFVLFSLLSIGSSLAPKESLIEARSLFLILIFYLFYILVDKKSLARRLTITFVIAGAVTGGYGIIQRLSGFDLLKHYHGRATGFFSLYLTLAEYLVITLSLTLGLILYSRGVKWKILLLPFLGVMLLGFTFTYSRGGWLGLMGSLITLGWLKNRRALGIILLVLIGMNLAFFFLPLGRVSLILHSLVDIKKGEEPGLRGAYLQSSKERLLMWQSGFAILSAKPHLLLTGIGMHALPSIYPEFRGEPTVHSNLWHLHSNLMQMLVSRGLLGLTAFLLIFIIYFKSALSGFQLSERGGEKGIIAGCIAGLVGFFISGLTEYNWGDTEVLMTVYAILGISLAVARLNKERG
jgi:O-antigen ligase